MAKKCEVCGSEIGLKKIGLFGSFENMPNSHWTGDGYICEKCLDKCAICPACHKYVKSTEVMNALKNANSFSFCHCEEDLQDLIKYEKAVLNTSFNSIKESIFYYQNNYCIPDRELASVLEISTFDLRNILKNNRELLQANFYELNNEELEKIRHKLTFYKTSEKAYFFTRKGVELIANIVSNTPSQLELYSATIKELSIKEYGEQQNVKRSTKKHNTVNDNIVIATAIITLLLTTLGYIYTWDWFDGILLNIAMLPIAVIASSIVLGIIIYGMLYSVYFICLFTTDSIKHLPKTNYHILGYITTTYLLFMTIYYWDNKINYGYYEFLRWSVSCFAFWSAYKINQKQSNIWFLIFVAIGILFNPIIKVALDKDIWQIIDLITFVLFCIYGYKNRTKV